MRVLMLNGSPNEHGGTDFALQTVAGELEKRGMEVKQLWIGKKAVQGCIACSRHQHGHCVFDDLVNVAIDEMRTADALVVGSPVYFASPNGSLLSFLDRMFACAKNMLEGKPYACLCVARRQGCSATLDTLLKYGTIAEMPISTSQYWTAIHGSNPAQLQKDLEGMQIMRRLGANLAWLMRCIEAGKEQGIRMDAHEAPVWTNFIS